jgi:hypothetical protein
MTLPRNLILDRLVEDLIGPKAPDEQFQELPTDRYLTGILYPRRSTIGAEEDDGLKGGGNGSGGDDNDADDDDTTIRLAGQAKPSTMGLSFSLATAGSTARLAISIRLGTYGAFHAGEGGHLQQGPAARLHESVWRRTDHRLELPAAELAPGYARLALPDGAPQGLELHCQALPEGRNLMVTLALVNANDRGEERYEGEERTFFQVQLEARGVAGTQILPRPFRGSRSDEDGRLATLIYRSVQHHAVGHTCSAAWQQDGDGVTVRTAWIPRCRVPGMSTKGGPAFRPLHDGGSLRPLSASWLAAAKPEDLIAGLSLVPSCYEAWIAEQEGRIASLPPQLQEIARTQLATCRGARQRISAAVASVGADVDVRRSFQLANEAIALPRRWSGKGDDLVWRPFQLAFFLLALESVADGGHPDREVMDLLWFPTGGGKTEAYLGIIAFLLFHRRLRHRRPDQGAGTAALMRYTLRALTIQQFQRAAGLVLACEHLRREARDPRFGLTPFSIGLWVGSKATPNTVQDAAGLAQGSSCDHRQLTFCPCCNTRLKWEANARQDQMAVRCPKEGCMLGAGGTELPVYTIDEDIYRVVPSLLIGTVDKFAQVARNPRTGRFFGLATDCSPPDLVVQDELHLISGPLGTIAGLYEVAIDHLCSRDGVRPKILGSTATIRRAADQILRLFDRQTCQFPPPGLDHDDSGFAVVDPQANGRLHAGVTTAGRSPKFTLQAVSASLLQAATCAAVPAAARNSYSTLLVYFNSLRELGGALVLMQDDVHATIAAYSQRHGEARRTLDVPEELTSRKSAAEIRSLLEQLEKASTSPEVLLASNMISVGVDIQRLALMVVNGQPKTIAEYIQATSRVGRGDTAGLVVSIYNNSRTRDRSHYESFATWHEGIYREVEATSVTPFAARAVEKAVHATLVALVRHLVPDMRDKPRLSAEAHKRVAALRGVILQRVDHIDPSERQAVEAALDRLIGEWTARHDLDEYWVDHGSKVGLMISAEQHAAKRASGQAVDQAWPTPNSMRDVEPSTMFRLGFPQKRTVRATEGQTA